MSDDYFSFMSERGHSKHVQAVERRLVPLPDPAVGQSVDAAAEAPDSKMEVTEKSVGETTIQRLFKRSKPDEQTTPTRRRAVDPP